MHKNSEDNDTTSMIKNKFYGVLSPGLCPCICLTGRVFEGVEFVISSSTQHQLKTQEKKESSSYLLFYVKLIEFVNQRAVSHPTFCPVDTKHFVLVGSQVIQRSLTAE